MAGTEVTVEITGRDVQELVLNLARALGSIAPGMHDADDPPRLDSVISVQAEAKTLSEMLNRLATDVIDTMAESPLSVSYVDLPQVLSTERGLRTWGYLWFGSERRTTTIASARVGLVEGATDDGHLKARLTMTSVAFPPDASDEVHP